MFSSMSFLNNSGSELIFGVLFVIWGGACIVLNKASGRAYGAHQKGWGLGDSAYVVGRIISVVGGSMAVIIGLVMIFVRRS